MPQPWEFFSGGGNLEQNFTIEARAAQLPSAVDAGESAARSLSDSEAGESAARGLPDLEAGESAVRSLSDLEAGESAARDLPDLSVSPLAAQPPAVADISVLASKDGVSAGCTFTGYTDKNEYIIQLFLNRVQEDGSVSEAAGLELDTTADGKGYGQTPAEKVETGIYKASAAIKRYEGGNLADTAFTHSVLYKVVKEKDSYEVTPYEKEPESSVEADKRPHVPDEGEVFAEENKEYRACDHEKDFEIVREADAAHDALMEEKCVKCGEVFSYAYVPNSAYAAFLKDCARAVLNVKGDEILLATDRWMSFNQEVLDAISARSEVAVTIHYMYCGKQFTVTIPAGTDAAGLADENGYCGFRCLHMLFAGEEVFL